MSDLMTVDELKDYLRIGKGKAYALMRHAAFPSIKIGRNYMVSEKEVEKWLAQYAGREFVM